MTSVVLSARTRVIRERAVQRGFDHLQTILSSKSQKHIGDDTPVLTKLDRELIATNNLNNTASRLDDANSILLKVISVLKDGTSSKNQRNQMANNIKSLLIPLNEGAAELLKKAAIDVAPLPGCYDHHKKCEVEKKKTAEEEVSIGVKKKKNITVEMELIANFLKDKEQSDTSTTTTTPPPRQKKSRAAKVTPQLEEDDISIPQPANGMEYTKSEAALILVKTDKGSKERALMMNKMIRLDWAPTTPRTLQRLLSQLESGELVLDTAWKGNGHNGGGRKRALTTDGIDNLVSKWNRGEAHGLDSISDAIIEERKDLIRRSGGVPVNVNESLGRTTISNYRTTIANHAGVSIVNKATGKSKTRVVAERSHRRLACFIGLVGSSHFITVPEEDTDIRDKLKTLDDDTRVMYDAVREARGTNVVPVKRHNTWTIDDSTVFKFAGTSSINNKSELVAKESVKASGNESIWTMDEGNAMRGLRVAFTFAFSGAGTSLPIVACVSGLSEQELPETDFLEVEIPGFCIGGGSNVAIKTPGYVLFMRDTPGAKQEKFKWYQQNVFVPGE